MLSARLRRNSTVISLPECQILRLSYLITSPCYFTDVRRVPTDHTAQAGVAQASPLAAWLAGILCTEALVIQHN